MRHIPILAYHSVSDHASEWIAEFTVSPRRFEAHLDAIADAGVTTLTVSELVDSLRAGVDSLPARAVLVTFDDGFEDFRSRAIPALAERGIRSTLYVVTHLVETETSAHGDPMLSWEDVAELAGSGVELGGHSHHHVALDALAPERARDEIGRCKRVLDAHLGRPVRSFAYPYGYSSPRVRQLVSEAGFDSACGVGNAFSHPRDDQLRLARILVHAHTTPAEISAWIGGLGAPLARRRERVRTRAWRVYRRAGERTGMWHRTEL